MLGVPNRFFQFEDSGAYITIDLREVVGIINLKKSADVEILLKNNDRNLRVIFGEDGQVKSEIIQNFIQAWTSYKLTCDNYKLFFEK